MRWPNPDEEPAGRTIIHHKDTAAKREAIHWTGDREAVVGAGVGMWRTDRSQSGNGRGGATAVCKHRDRWKAFRSHLGTERIEVYDADLWGIGLAHRESLRKWDTQQTLGVTNVAVFSDSQVAI